MSHSSHFCHASAGRSPGKAAKSGRATIALAIFLLGVGCGRRADKLPVYDSVPEFSATDSRGQRFTRADMAGKVWIVDFIYTYCPAECPMMSSRMKGLAAEMKNYADTGILSISVDPGRDTPPVLQAFADRYGGGNEQWRFLAASPEMVHLLAFETFHVGDVLGKLEHSTKFAVVDKTGRIRGYYSSLSRDDLTKLAEDVKALRG